MDAIIDVKGIMRKKIIFSKNDAEEALASAEEVLNVYERSITESARYITAGYPR